MGLSKKRTLYYLPSKKRRADIIRRLQGPPLFYIITLTGLGTSFAAARSHLSILGINAITSIGASNTAGGLRFTAENVFHVVRRKLSHSGFVQFERFHFSFVLVN